MKEFFFIYASNVEFPKWEDVTEFAFTNSRGYIPVWEEDQDLKIEDFKYLFDVNEAKGRDIICSISKSYNLYKHERRKNP